MVCRWLTASPSPRRGNQDLPIAGERDQRDVARLSGFEPHCGAGSDIEAHATGLLALELQGRVGFEKMVMRANLNWSVAAVGDGNRHSLASRIELDLAVLDELFARDHVTSPI